MGVALSATPYQNAFILQGLSKKCTFPLLSCVYLQSHLTVTQRCALFKPSLDPHGNIHDDLYQWSLSTRICLCEPSLFRSCSRIQLYLAIDSTTSWLVSPSAPSPCCHPGPCLHGRNILKSLSEHHPDVSRRLGDCPESNQRYQT